MSAFLWGDGTLSPLNRPRLNKKVDLGRTTLVIITNVVLFAFLQFNNYLSFLKFYLYGVQQSFVLE